MSAAHFLVLLSLLSLSFRPSAAVPACKSNEGEPGRFPLWPATYNMQDSTIIQPCNMSGFLDAELFSQYGVVSVGASAPPLLLLSLCADCTQQ